MSTADASAKPAVGASSELPAEEVHAVLFSDNDKYMSSTIQSICSFRGPDTSVTCSRETLVVLPKSKMVLVNAAKADKLCLPLKTLERFADEHNIRSMFEPGVWEDLMKMGTSLRTGYFLLLVFWGAAEKTKHDLGDVLHTLMQKESEDTSREYHEFSR
jgi:hypothetical protein